MALLRMVHKELAFEVPETYVLPSATADSLGGVTLTTISNIASSYAADAVTSTGVLDTSLSIEITSAYTDADNTLSSALVDDYTSKIASAVDGLSNYTLPAATSDTLGGVTLDSVTSIASDQATSVVASVSTTITSEYMSAIAAIDYLYFC